MFKTILKIAVLSATTITLLSACGAATKALNDAIKDFENRARSANTQSSIDEFGNLTLRAPTTAEICSDVPVADLWVSSCDNDEASLQRLYEFCLNNPLNYDCVKDDRHNSARLEACTDNFSIECTYADRITYADRMEFYALRIKFCNNPANADHEACFVPSEPTLDPYGRVHSEFLQGTADGLNTGNLRASGSDATAPVVHILKLSDSDDGVAFFAGVMPDIRRDDSTLYYNRERSYYAGILPDPNLGAPITQTSGKAVWQGTFSVLTTSLFRSDPFRTDADFDLEIDFAENQLSASISVKNTYEVSDYRLSGVFTDGKIEARLYSDDFYGPPNPSVRVQGLIGQDAAIGAFMGPARGASVSGGFVARPPSE